MDKVESFSEGSVSVRDDEGSKSEDERDAERHYMPKVFREDDSAVDVSGEGAPQSLLQRLAVSPEGVPPALEREQLPSCVRSSASWNRTHSVLHMIRKTRPRRSSSRPVVEPPPEPSGAPHCTVPSSDARREQWEDPVPGGTDRSAPTPLHPPNFIRWLVCVSTAVAYSGALLFFGHYLLKSYPCWWVGWEVSEMCITSSVSLVRWCAALALVLATTVSAGLFYLSLYLVVHSHPGVVPPVPWVMPPQMYAGGPYHAPPHAQHLLPQHQKGRRSSDPSPPLSQPERFLALLPLSEPNASTSAQEGERFTLKYSNSPVFPHHGLSASASLPPLKSDSTASVDAPLRRGEGGGEREGREELSRDSETDPSTLALFNPNIVYWHSEVHSWDQGTYTSYPSASYGAASTAHSRAGMPASNNLPPTPQPQYHPRFCSYCEQYMPDRSYHCVRCRRCLFLYDHHCNITNTCVGEGNFKIFAAFVIHSFMFSSIALMSMLLGVFYFKGWGSFRYPRSLYWLPLCAVAAAWFVFCGFLMWQIFLINYRFGLTAEEFFRWHSISRRREMRQQSNMPLPAIPLVSHGAEALMASVISRMMLPNALVPAPDPAGDDAAAVEESEDELNEVSCADGSLEVHPVKESLPCGAQQLWSAAERNEPYPGNEAVSVEENMADDDFPMWPPRFPLYLYQYERPEDQAQRIQAHRDRVWGPERRWWDFFIPTAVKKRS